ncbi:hypothetical protein QVA66_11295 [Staphylococcus chromogenes]|nr:hypothetical protein [Staphylococcus chromogenes]
MSNPFDPYPHQPEGQPSNPWQAQQNPYQVQQPYQQPFPQGPQPSGATQSFYGVAWNIFTNNAGAIIGAGFVYLLAAILLMVSLILPISLLPGVSSTETGGELSDALGMTAAIVVLGLAGFVHCMYIANLQRVTEQVWHTGQKVNFTDMFRFHRVGVVFVAGLLWLACYMLGAVVVLIGALVAAFFLMYFLPAAMHHGVGAAFSRSCSLAKNNATETVVLLLIIIGFMILENFSFGLVGIITTPLVAMYQTVAYLMFDQKQRPSNLQITPQYFPGS